MSDHKAGATKVVALIEADLRRYDWRYMPATAHGYVEAALSAAYTRGHAKGLREAREIASGQFGWDVSVWLDMTKKDMTRLMAEAIVFAIDARLSAINTEEGR